VCADAVLYIYRNLVSASQDGKLIVWDGYTTNKVVPQYFSCRFIMFIRIALSFSSLRV